MIGIEKSNAGARERVRSSMGSRTIRELSQLSRVRRNMLAGFLKGSKHLSMREARDVAEVLGVSTTYLIRGGEQAGEDPSIAWLLASLRHRRGGMGVPRAQHPPVPQVVTVLTDRMVIVRWSPWSATPLAAIDIRQWDNLGPADIVAAELAAGSIEFEFADQRLVRIGFEELSVLAPDESPEALTGWIFDDPGSIGIVSVMKNGDKQRRVGKSRAAATRAAAAPKIEFEEGVEWIGLPAAAKKMSVHPQTLRKYIKNGSLPANKVGPRLIKIKVEDLRKFMGSHQPPK